MRTRLSPTLLWLAACAGLDALIAWWLDWSFERAVVLAPVVVAVVGATAFLIVLWTRIALDSFHRRRDRHGGRGR